MDATFIVGELVCLKCDTFEMVVNRVIVGNKIEVIYALSDKTIKLVELPAIALRPA